MAIWITNPYRNTGKMCLGGGMHCPSASSFVCILKILFAIFSQFCFIFNDTLQRPRELQGYTTTIVNDDGHLRPQFRRSKTGSLSTFVGTWDLPRRLPGISATSRLFYLSLCPFLNGITRKVIGGFHEIWKMCTLWIRLGR